MKLKKHHITFLFLVMWCFCYAQNYTQITVNDGLPSNLVYKSTQDYKGFIWFATDKGLVKYNGNTFKTFSTQNGLAANDIWNILPTKDNKLWFLSKTSALGYIKNDSIYSFKSEVEGEIFNPIYTYHLNNEVILTSPLKSYGLVNNQWKVLLENKPRSVRSLLYVKHPNIKNIEMFDRSDSLIVHTKGNTAKSFTIPTISGYQKRGQITDSLYFWTDHSAYHILNLNSQKLSSKTFIDQVNKPKVEFSRINLINNQLQITGKGFVGVLDNNFNIIDPFYFPEELEAHFGLIDRLGSVWLSTFNRGVFYFPKNKQQLKYHLQNDKITNIKKVNEKMLVKVFNKGFFEYDTASKSLKPFLLDKDYFFSADYIKEMDTEFYLSKQTIYSARNKTIVKQPYSDKLTGVYKHLQFFKGNLYAIITNGIVKLNPKTFQIETEYIENGVTQLLVFKDRLIISTTNGLKELKNDVIIPIKLKNKVFNTSILSVQQLSDNQIAVNTDGFGTYISDLNTIKQLPKSEFLIVNNAFSNATFLWLATNSGVWCFDKTENGYKYTKTINTANGLPSNQVNSVFASDDDLLVATSSGLVSMPINISFSSQLIDIYVDQILYNNQQLADYTRVNYQDNNNVNIKVQTIDFSANSSKINYKYRLHPLQKKWNTSTTPNLNFNNLQPLDYTLYVEKNGIKKAFHFTIRPLWWQTIWFKIAFGLLVAFVLFSIVWLLSKNREKKKNQKILQEKQMSDIQLKALRSQMNPHFVFNSLAAIQYYINENNFEASEIYLVKFSKLIRQFFELSKENEITLYEEINLLKSYLEIEKLRFKDKLDFEIICDKKIQSRKIKIPSMLLQPIVENAVNHGIFNKVDNGKVTITINEITSQTIEIKITDDGVGFANTTTDAKKHHSSNVVSDRLKFLNQTGFWNITFTNKALDKTLKDEGHQAIFTITKLKK